MHLSACVNLPLSSYMTARLTSTLSDGFGVWAACSYRCSASSSSPSRSRLYASLKHMSSSSGFAVNAASYASIAAMRFPASSLATPWS